MDRRKREDGSASFEALQKQSGLSHVCATEGGFRLGVVKVNTRSF